VQAAVRLAPGNSGGPLADIHGRIIGINAMVMNGLGLAVPSEAVQRILSAAPPLHLGVTVRPAQLGDGTRGMLILGVEPESPAWRASLLPGDLISGIDAGRTTGVEAMEAALAKAGAEKRTGVIVHFRRGGYERERQTTAAQALYAEPAA
jgi:serine protease Do